jgi:hypothetical protein
MRRSLASGILAVVLHIASLSAQQREGWGDELPPAPAVPESLLVVPRIDLSAGWPAPPLNRPPETVRALYLNAWAFGGKRFHELVRLAERTEINAFVVDVKDDTGYLTYRSRCRPRSGSAPIPNSAPATSGSGSGSCGSGGSIRSPGSSWPGPLLAAQKPEWAVRHVNGGLWRDRLDFAWVDAFNDSVWIYAAQVAAEAVRVGFAEVQYDYVRFPDEPESRLASALFPGRRQGESARA